HPNQKTFIRAPKTATELEAEKARPEMGTIDASSTSTVLMALAGGDKLSLFYEEKNANAQLAAVVTELYEAKWTSADLKDLNFFTASLVFRALGILNERDSALLSAFSTKKHEGKSYEDLSAHFKSIDPAQGKVGGGDESKYPLTSAL